jgi:hypothetical protein
VGALGAGGCYSSAMRMMKVVFTLTAMVAVV